MTNALGAHHAPAVLLLDDSRGFLSGLAAFLRAHGVTVVGAFEDAGAAVANARALGPEVAVVDFRMPGMSGPQAIARLREALPELGIVVLTLAAAPAYRRLALAAGADAFVDKAAFDTDLLPAIAHAAAVARRHHEAPLTTRGEEASSCS